MSGNDSDGGGIMGGVEDFKGSDRKAARMARFNNRLAGNRYKEVRCFPTMIAAQASVTHSSLSA